MSANPILVSAISQNPIAQGSEPVSAESKNDIFNGRIRPGINGDRQACGLQAFPDTPVENFRPLRVIIIGAGFSGIYMGIRIPEWLRNINLTIYEKNAGVGGTWFENRYPGVACGECLANKTQDWVRLS